MLTLTEIEAAADTLSNQEKGKLLNFLAEKLRKDHALPELRIYTDEEVTAMLAEDESDGARFRAEN